MSDFSKNTITLVIGTVLAQSIPLVLHPFLRRIYSAEDFGAIAVFLSIFSMISIVSSLRYEATIVLPKDDSESINIVALTALINLAFAMALTLSLVFFKSDIIAWLNFPPEYSGYLYFLPLTCFAFSVYQSMNFWLIRKKAFRASTNNKVIRRGAEGAVQAGLGILHIPGGLFIGDLIGNVSNLLAGFRQVILNGLDTSAISAKRMKEVFWKYIDYPKYNVIPTFLSSAATLLPFLIINKYYSTETVGYLDLSRLVLSIPLIFISSTISQVLFQQITEKKHRSESIYPEIRNILFMLLGVIALEIIIVQLVAPLLFGWVFGEQYELSGEFSKILVFSFAMNFLSSTFSSVFITFERIKINSVWQILYFLMICSLILFRDVDIYQFLIAYAAIEVIMHSISCGMIFSIIRQYERRISP